MIAELGPGDESGPLVEHLFTEVLDGRHAHLADGVERALGPEPRGFTDLVSAAASSTRWKRPPTPAARATAEVARRRTERTGRGDGAGAQGSSTTLPVTCRSSMRASASAAFSSGNVSLTSGSSAPERKYGSSSAHSPAT